jgi:hypothetical protein
MSREHKIVRSIDGLNQALHDGWRVTAIDSFYANIKKNQISERLMFYLTRDNPDTVPELEKITN